MADIAKMVAVFVRIVAVCAGIYFFPLLIYILFIFEIQIVLEFKSN